MVHVVKSLPVKSTNDVHYVFDYYWTMKCSWLWAFWSNCFNLNPFSLVNVELMNITKSYLICIYTSKNIDRGSAKDSWVAIPRLRRRAVSPMYFIPIIGEKAILKYVVHGVVTVPASKNKHRVLENNCWMPEPIQGLYAFALDFLPFVFFILNTAFVNVPEAFFAVKTSVNEKTTFP